MHLPLKVKDFAHLALINCYLQVGYRYPYWLLNANMDVTYIGVRQISTVPSKFMQSNSSFQSLNKKYNNSFSFKTCCCVFFFKNKAVIFTVVKFPLTPIGVLAPGSAQARLSAWPPIDVSGNFTAHMSAEAP